MYNEKRMGPRMEPWGTPQCRGARDEVASPIPMENCLPVRYDLNHSRAVPDMPTECCSRVIRIVWSIVSKAAVRSSSTRIEQYPESAAIRRSLTTFRRAVSVLCSARKPDWNFSKRKFPLRWSTS